MPDAQIVASEVSAAPLVYKLADSAEFILRAVNAHYDGSGAASAWLPCVEIVSDSNHIIARAVDQAVIVTAGDDAEVSWFPGVKHSATVGLSGDWSSPQQFVPIFEIGNWAGGPFTGFTTLTQDSVCFHGGRLVSTGAQSDAIAVRFGLSPKGSVWGFYMMHTTGPDHGIAFFYLARLPDNDPFASLLGPFDPSNLLGEIDDANADFTYILGAKINCYSAALTRNVVTFFGFKPLAPFTSTDFRVTGQPGHAMTAPSVDPILSLVTTGDGGPGVYALKISMDDKQAASTGYKLGIQSLAATRTDAIWT